MKITKDTKIGNIWAHQEGKAILLKHTPDMDQQPMFELLKTNTLAIYANTKVTQSPDEWLTAVLADLSNLDLSRNWEEEATFSSSYEDISIAYGSATVRAFESAEKWSVFEIELQGPSHGNPYVDVTLGAEFTCAGRQFNVRGFYDGDGVYRIRFMPDQEGEWSYCTSSNARSLEGIRGSFICTPPQDGNHGPVRVADTFHFAYEDGTRYLPIGTTCYAWTHQDEALEELTLSTLAQSAFTKIRMCVFPKSFLFNENEPPRHPFAGSPEEGWDFTRFSPQFFRHLERRIADLGRLGIEADLILFHPYDRWGYAAMEPSVNARYLSYLTARLSAFRNLWWSLANEFELLWDKLEEDWERFAQIIAAGDPYGHLISNHNFVNFYDFSRPWVTHCSIQKNEMYRTAELTDQWRKQWNKPVVIDECAYEGNVSPTWGNITGEEMVRRFWEGAVRGGYVGHGETYVHPQDILWWSKGGELHGSSPDRIGFLRRIIEEAPSGILNPLSTEWELIAGIEDEFYLYYFTFGQPSYYDFSMKPGYAYKVEVIDTWNMTVEELDGNYEGQFQIKLPGRPYMAVSLTRMKNA
jgi:hypothetical protein